LVVPWAARRVIKYAPERWHMHEAGDKIEELSTGRKGEIRVTQSDGSRGDGITTDWQVVFEDGTRKTFRDENEMKSLMKRPDAGISPAEPLQK
jgi:hypothetical protein